MTVFRAIYASRPFGFDAGVLNNILLDARRANARDGITGALICRHDIYLQWLEGPEEKVRAALARIERDDRHVDLVLRVADTQPDRQFGDWAMLHDPAVSWIWPPEDVAKGAAAQAGPLELEAIFARLRDMVGRGGAV
ncbi:BLUF domain-containing protein [Meridianimarinicoccus sp. RP-17]|uniref:BLUF domain-containing protein n=1 Tax=Meridianimarinicoccus zhengii TaxID=2056810 RepID=UPI000DAF189E|nr:BLUF domain-containing protein [Phycocomes zhengii]